PMWIIGILADVAGFGLQFVALDRGSLVLVQPLLVSGLLFALPFGAALTHRRLTASEWLGSAATVAGLALFLVVASPGPGQDRAPHLARLLPGACTPAPTPGLVAASPAPPLALSAGLLPPARRPL